MRSFISIAEEKHIVTVTFVNKYMLKINSELNEIKVS